MAALLLYPHDPICQNLYRGRTPWLTRSSSQKWRAVPGQVGSVPTRSERSSFTGDDLTIDQPGTLGGRHRGDHIQTRQVGATTLILASLGCRAAARIPPCCGVAACWYDRERRFRASQPSISGRHASRVSSAASVRDIGKNSIENLQRAGRAGNSRILSTGSGDRHRNGDDRRRNRQRSHCSRLASAVAQRTAAGVVPL